MWRVICHSVHNWHCRILYLGATHTRATECEIYTDTTAGRSARCSPCPAVHNKRFIDSWQFALSAVVVALTVILVVFVLSILNMSHGSPYLPVCLTGPCRHYASMLNESIDTDQNPCDDFYQYVCGGWQKKHDRAVYENLIAGFVARLRKTLEVPVPGEGHHATEKAAKFFQSCMTAATSDSGELNKFRQIWHDIGIDWPDASKDADILKTLIRLQTRLRIDNILKIRSSLSFISLSSTDLILKMHERRKKLVNAHRYRRYYETLQEMVMQHDTTDKDLLDYAELVRVEDIIYNTLIPTTSTASSFMMLNTSELAELSHIDLSRWLEVFQSELHTPYTVTVFVFGINYTEAFFRLVRDVGERELHRFVGWINVQLMGPVVNNQLGSFIAREIPMAAEADLRCVQITEVFMGSATYAQYASQEFDAYVSNDIRKIVDTIMTTTASHIDDKLQLFSTDIGFWEHLQADLNHSLKYINKDNDLSVLDAAFSKVGRMSDSLADNMLDIVRNMPAMNETDYSQVYTSVVAHITDPYNLFDTIEHRWSLPPYATMLPIYAFRVTSAVKYGALGSLVARAAINTRTLTSSGFEAMTNCTVQHGDHKIAVLKSVLSLQLARKSHKVSSPSADEVGLYGLTHTGTQIFFIAACYLMCGLSSTVVPAGRMCNEQSSLHPEFADVFSCTKDNPMYSTKRCHL